MTLNRGCSYREQIGPSSDGLDVLTHLAARHRHSTREIWLERVNRGEVALDGAVVRPAAALRAGQVLEWRRPPWHEPDVPLHFEVVHEDDAILAVSKPRGLPTMPAGGFLDHTLWTIVRHRDPDAHPVHRLGRHTSGLVIFARTPAAAGALGLAFRRHELRKRYRALASGVVVQDRFEVEAPIGPVPHPLLGSIYAASPHGKPAHTEAFVLARREHDTLLQVDITTGRPHQIRIHLAIAGFPLVGDPVYGPGGVPRAVDPTDDDPSVRPALPGDGGYFLHAGQLRFVHPATGREISLHATAPPELHYSAHEELRP